MLGIIVQLLISWLLAWIVVKKNLSILGFYPTSKRLKGFFLFFFVTAFFCSTGFIMKIIFAREQWQLNPDLTPTLIYQGSLWQIISVLYEELIFRGVLLYILIKKIGSVKAIIISAIAFGIYHWFSQGVFGDIKQMIIIFIYTGIMGLLLAYAYAKTFSLYIPVAIHFGWNLTQGFIFSNGPIGNGIFIPILPQPVVTVSYFIFFCMMLIPVLGTFLINYFLLRRQAQVLI